MTSAGEASQDSSEAFDCGRPDLLSLRLGG